jgi:Mlc titration factor MtfA (ptsG expression regulator)
MLLVVHMPAYSPSSTDMLLGLAMLVVFFLLIYKLRSYLVNRSVLFPRLDQQDLHAKFGVFLEKNSFYNSLDGVGKQKMLERCIRFASQKRFIGSKDFVVTGEMVVAISATAVRLTFGLERYDLPRYHTIRIFPTSFYSPFHKRELKGGASTKGVLFFSWADFVQGESIENDRINLGLHEMAHALRLELRYGKGADRRVADYFDSWFGVAFEEFQKVREGDGNYLRDYAGTNPEEFFAVCVEHFFEDAENFSKELPDVYAHLCLLLNLDPLNKEDNFAYSRDLILARSTELKYELPEKIKRNYRYDSWHWSFNMIIAGFFVFLPIIFYCISIVAIGFSDVLLPIAVMTFVVVSFRSFWFTKGVQLYRHLFMFALVGVSFPGLAALLMVNINFHQSYFLDFYSIYEYESRAVGNKIRVEYTFNSVTEEFPDRFRQVDLTVEQSKFVDANQMIIMCSYGVMGWKNIHIRSLVLDGYDMLEVDKPEL